jgi:hypothetical protein
MNSPGFGLPGLTNANARRCLRAFGETRRNAGLVPDEAALVKATPNINREWKKPS